MAPHLLLQVSARVQHALVVRLSGDDVALLPFVEVGHALGRDVVRLGRPRGEDDLLRAGADQSCHLLIEKETKLKIY